MFKLSNAIILMGHIAQRSHEQSVTCGVVIRYPAAVLNNREVKLAALVNTTLDKIFEDVVGQYVISHTFIADDYPNKSGCKHHPNWVRLCSQVAL